MSLSRTLLNGGMVGTSIDATKYGHSEGAFRIARESMEELHEIFIESFYNVEQAELAAATEGVELYESQYQAVAEAAIGNAFQKIKEFLKKLLEKVKGFFHNIKKWFDMIFKSGKDFATKYKSEINGLPSFKDYKVKMYKYDDAVIDNTEFSSATEILNNQWTKMGGADVDEVYRQIAKLKDKSGKDFNDTVNQHIKEKPVNKDITEIQVKDFETPDQDEIEKSIVSSVTDGGCNDPDDFDKYMFGYFRNGAESADDMEEEELTKSDVIKMMNTLINTKASGKIDKATTAVEKGYNKFIKELDKIAEKLDDYKTASGEKNKYAQSAAQWAREYSSSISTCQTYTNRSINAWKRAYQERDSAYKKAIYGAFGYAKKYAKEHK